MGCNLSIISKSNRKLVEKRVLILGLDNAGKSSLLNQLKEHQFKETAPTIGLNVETVEIANFSISFWDVGGQATMLWSHYYEDTNAILFVVDLSEDSRLVQVKAEFDKLINEKVLSGCPIIVLGNKMDIDPHLTEEDIMTALDYTNSEKKKKLKYVSVSAKNGTGITALKDQIVDLLGPITPVSTETTNSPPTTK